MRTAFQLHDLKYVLVVVLLSIVGISCAQFEYASPMPGVLEVRLAVKNNRTDLIPFSSLNNFPILLRKVEAIEPGNIRLQMYSDLFAIRRNPDGEIINTLDTLARDSSIVLAKSYAPPHTFVGIDLTAELAPVQGFGVTGSYAVQVFNGFFLGALPVVEPLPRPPTLHQLPRAGRPPLAIKVNEGRLTRVTITFDLDTSLVRKTEWFQYNPYFYVSSVENF